MEGMSSYSDFIERVLLADGLLEKLHPADVSDRDRWRRILDADEASLAGGKAVGNATMFPLIRGGLLYALDDLFYFFFGCGDILAESQVINNGGSFPSQVSVFIDAADYLFGDLLFFFIELQ